MENMFAIAIQLNNLFPKFIFIIFKTYRALSNLSIFNFIGIKKPGSILKKSIDKRELI